MLKGASYIAFSKFSKSQDGENFPSPRIVKNFQQQIFKKFQLQIFKNFQQQNFEHKTLWNFVTSKGGKVRPKIFNTKILNKSQSCDKSQI